MITLLKMPALFLGMLAVFCCLGSFFIRENRYESGHLGETVLFGFIAYYFLFELISVPMMVLGAKLHLLAWVWAAVVAVLVIASICLHLGMWREWGKRSGGFWRGKTAAFYVMLVLIGIQLYFVAALQENGSADAAYYVGSVTTNLATDSISSFDPYTGKALDFFNIRYVFSMYPAANAVLCRLTGLHPLVVTKVILCMMSVGMVDDAYKAVADIAADGGTILFVGTKKQAQDAIAVEAERCGMYYVNERWLGGMLTNFKTIQSRIARLKAIETMEQDGTFEVLPKKEVIELKKELAKLQKNLGGIKEMKRLPDAIFVVDPKKERICVQEAHTLGIPLIGICDTNCDPEELDYVIPGNDDAIRAVKLIVSKMADAVIEAKQGEAEEAAYEEAAETDAE